jgi:hypothetical protein
VALSFRTHQFHIRDAEVLLLLLLPLLLLLLLLAVQAWRCSSARTSAMRCAASWGCGPSTGVHRTWRHR